MGRAMKVLFASSECHPFLKTGGLGDVAWALPRSLREWGTDVRVILPKYGTIPPSFQEKMRHVTDFTVTVGYRRQFCGVEELTMEGITYYFIDNMYYFDREGAYGYMDDGERFSFFSLAVIECMERIGFVPDVLHCNDWHTALIPLLLPVKYSWIHAYQKIRTVLTIHNLKFQGVFPREVLGDLLGIGDSVMRDDGVEFYGQVNFLKGGINYAQAVTTVSPTYAREIRYPFYGEGLHGLMERISYKFSGILNGIDIEENDPASDPFLPAHYSLTHRSGKKECKRALQCEVGLPQKDVPLLAIISRLTDQKGLDLVAQTLDELLQKELQLVVVGTGDARYEEMFHSFAARYPQKVSSQIRFDRALAQRVYAGADFMLVPSRFEPCGLTQMVAMRYGTVPIVRETGGLADTVIPYNKFTGQGLGFTFMNYDPQDFKGAVERALETYANKEAFEGIQESDMRADHSWGASAKKYLALYEKITQME
ncbi:Glycogen synthase, ADP-glucose transglucosylase [Clostridiaceae bacterium JG1575]|nr:Glycogen synthase, ADP-glucose transglucosylase [Clostridiaceae bacterium JG1575]